MATAMWRAFTPSQRCLSLLFSLCSLVPFVIAQNYCYSAAGIRAGSAIVPCAGGSGYSACCQIGDLCLSDSACWNPEYNVTYLYGCTDPSYTDPTCPYKCGSDYDSSPYVGLEYCSNFTNNEWACTHPPAGSDAIQPNPPQQCYDDSIIAFAGPVSLQPILSLPTVVGGSTVYFSELNPTSYVLVPGYTPTTTDIVYASVPTSPERVSNTAAATTSSTPASSSSSPTITSPSPTSTPSTSTPSTGMSTTSRSSIPSSTTSRAQTEAAATPSRLATTSTTSNSNSSVKTAIGIGVAVGIVGLGAGVFFVWFLRRRHQRRQNRRHRQIPSIDYSQCVDQTQAFAHEKRASNPGPPAELSSGFVPSHRLSSKSDMPSEIEHARRSGTTPSPDGTSPAAWDSPVSTYSSYGGRSASPFLSARVPEGANGVHEM